MTIKELYLGPNFEYEPVAEQKPLGEITAADQARGFGVPEEQLQPEAPATVEEDQVPPAGLPKSFWQNLGVGR
jgi:hypothetical protein